MIARPQQQNQLATNRQNKQATVGQKLNFTVIKFRFFSHHNVNINIFCLHQSISSTRRPLLQKNI